MLELWGDSTGAGQILRHLLHGRLAKEKEASVKKSRDADLMQADMFYNLVDEIGLSTYIETRNTPKPDSHEQEVPARIKRELVMDFILSRGYATFTTSDVAEALHAREYAARAAVSWLKLADFIEVYGWHKEREHVKVYIWTGKSDPVEPIRRNKDERDYVKRCKCSEKAATNVQELLNQMMRMRK